MEGDSLKSPGTACVAFAVGCPRNQMDTAWLSAYFRANGWRLTHRVREADLIAVATCGFSAHVEDESIRLLALLDKKRRRDSRLLIVGCLAGINGARVSEQFNATAIPPAHIDRLDQMISAKIALRDIPPVNCIEPSVLAAKGCWQVREMYPDMSAFAAFRHRIKRSACSLLSRVGTERFAMRTVRRFNRRSADGPADPIFYIRVARGCLEECSYCAIRYAAGTLRSKPLEDILAEFDRGLAERHKTFEILAEDIGPYGLDIGSDCVALFEHLFRRQGAYKLIVTDLNVRYLIRFTPRLSDVLAAHADRICVLKVPVQSGSDRILELMKRSYTNAEMKASLTYLREKAPTLTLSTHILVGFPGETDEDFEKTMDLLRAVRFDRILTYLYTDRPNTVSSTLPDKVPEPVKRQRVHRLVSEFSQAEACSFDESREARAAS
jgi:tRNA A37 methylthiotransferase MiaB